MVGQLAGETPLVDKGEAGLAQGEARDRMLGGETFQVSGLGSREPGTGIQVRVQVQDLNYPAPAPAPVPDNLYLRPDGRDL